MVHSRSVKDMKVQCDVQTQMNVVRCNGLKDRIASYRK